MHSVARVSIKFKAIFRAHRFLLIVIDHHWWTLNGEVIIRRWTRYGKWLLMGGLRGTQGRRAAFLFFTSSLQWRMKNEDSPTVFSVGSVSSPSLFGSKKQTKKKTTGIWVAFSQILSPCVFCLCVATQASGLSFITHVVFTPGVVVYLL